MADDGTGGSPRSIRDPDDEPVEKALHGTCEAEVPRNANETSLPDHSTTVAQLSADLESGLWIQESAVPSTTGGPLYPSVGTAFHVQVKESSGFHVGQATHHHYHYHQESSGERGPLVTPETHEDSTPPNAAAPQTNTGEAQIRHAKDVLQPLTTEVARIEGESKMYRTFCQRMTKDLFVETTGWEQANEIISHRDTLTIIGHSGYGKTSLLRYISANIPEYLPIQCINAEEVRSYVRLVQGSNMKFLFVLDEPISAYKSGKLVDYWVSMSKILEMCLGVHKFLFTFKSSTWAHCELEARFKSNPLFCNRVELTPTNLTDGDKRKIIKKHLGDAARLTDREIDTIVRIKTPVAFCQCCKLMGEAINQKGCLTGKEITKIFAKPISYLTKELQKMKGDERDKYATLCLVMCGDIKCRELSGTSSDVTPDILERIKVIWETCGCKDAPVVANIQDCAEKLSGTFLEKVHKPAEHSTSCEVYTFAHDSVHEAVIMHYGNLHFRRCLQFFSSDLIVKISRPQSYQKEEHDCVICVPNNAENNQGLAKVFTEAVIAGSWSMYDVFQNPFVREKIFQTIWVDYLKLYGDKLTAFRESISWDGESVYHLSHRCGAKQLWKFLIPNRIESFPVHVVNMFGFGHLHYHSYNTLSVDSSWRHSTVTPVDARSHRAFVKACEIGDMKTLISISQEINSDRLDDTIVAGLRKACYYGQRDIAEYLLEEYFNPCRKDKCGCTVGLWEATFRGEIDIVVLLLESHGIDVNIADIYGVTGLHRAAQSGQTRTVETLLKKGANIDFANDSGRTGLHRAAYWGHIQTVRMLLQYGADIDIRDKNGSTGLCWAAKNGHIETVQTLLQYGAKINITNEDGCTELHLAAQNGHTETVQILLQRGAKMNITNEDGCTELHLAAKNGHTETVKILILKEADINMTDQNGWTGLHVAANNGHIETVLTLLQYGAKMNITNKDGCTELHLAAKNGHIETVQTLLQYGAKMDITNKDGCTELHLAAKNGHTETVEILLLKGADINMTDHNGWTGLHVAATNGHLLIVETLLQHGADINMTDKYGFTGLQCAANIGHTGIVETLLQHGVDKNMTAKGGSTPLNLAAR